MKYRCILADPPWKYDDRMANMKSTGDGAASKYGVMSEEDIKYFLINTPMISPGAAVKNLEGMIADDAVLWLWVTNAFLEAGHRVVRAWGFTPKTMATWVKLTIDKGPELWRLHPTWPLEVSTHGHIRRPQSRNYFKWDGQVYPRIGFSHNGQSQHERVHVLVAETFLGSRPEGYDIDHLDGNKQEPCLNNLEYVTRSKNKQRAAEDGIGLGLRKDEADISRTQRWRRSKLQIGQGHSLRNVTEHVILATRGRPQVLVHNLPTAFFARRTEHSRKPDIVHEWAERLSAGPRLELFARKRRDGWDAVGDQL